MQQTANGNSWAPTPRHECAALRSHSTPFPLATGRPHGRWVSGRRAEPDPEGQAGRPAVLHRHSRHCHAAACPVPCLSCSFLFKSFHFAKLASLLALCKSKVKLPMIYHTNTTPQKLPFSTLGDSVHCGDWRNHRLASQWQEQFLQKTYCEAKLKRTFLDHKCSQFM